MTGSRYNQICQVHECDRWCRYDDVVCKAHYEMLPAALRRKLWGPREEQVLALQWIDEQEGRA